MAGRRRNARNHAVSYNDNGSACGLVSARDFKSCGSAYGGPVGSIPTHFRQPNRGRLRQVLDESTKAEAFPSRKGSQAASAQRDRVASADPAP